MRTRAPLSVLVAAAVANATAMIGKSYGAFLAWNDCAEALDAAMRHRCSLDDGLRWALEGAEMAMEREEELFIKREQRNGLPC